MISIKAYHYAIFLKSVGYNKEAEKLLKGEHITLKPTKKITLDGEEFFLLKLNGGIRLIHCIMGVKNIGIHKNVYNLLTIGEDIPIPNKLYEDKKYEVMADGTLYCR